MKITISIRDGSSPGWPVISVDGVPMKVPAQFWPQQGTVTFTLIAPDGEVRTVWDTERGVVEATLGDVARKAVREAIRFHMPLPEGAQIVAPPRPEVQPPPVVYLLPNAPADA